ncbi:hypothetical protein QBE52_12715 [Clostridiaceae bacterium 35-E11]
MEDIKNYGKESFLGMIFIVGIMIVHLFFINLFVDGKFPSVWIGLLIGNMIRNKIKDTKEREMYFLCGAMIINYILFIFSIYIPNYIVFFIGFSAILIYYINKEKGKYKIYKIALVCILIIGFFFTDYYMYSSNLIKDRNFCRLIRKEYAIKGRIQKEDLMNIEKLFLDDDYHINSIEGIEHFTNLKRLNIWDGSIIKNFTPLAKLKNIEHLMIWYVNVDKLEEIDTMTSLEWLEIVYPKGGQIDHLNNFPNIKRFAIQGMSFENLKGLKGPTQLEKLDIGDGQVISFEGIENFPNLTELDLYELSITDISKIFELENLKKVRLQGGFIHHRDEFEKKAEEKDIKVEKTKPFQDQIFQHLPTN